MSNERLYRRIGKHTVRGAAILVLVVGVLLVGSPATGQEKNEPAPPTLVPGPYSVPQEAGSGPVSFSASSTPQSGPQEGVEVHGHWTIEIRDPDGTVVDRREFENALVASGAASLAKILGRQTTVGLWEVQIASNAGSPCIGFGLCIIAEGSSGGTGSNVFKNLTLNVPTSGLNANRLVLSGNMTAGLNDTINQIFTRYVQCPPTTTPASNCETGSFSIFTSTFLSPVVPVSAGQQIQVTVVISFS